MEPSRVRDERWRFAPPEGVRRAWAAAIVVVAFVCGVVRPCLAHPLDGVVLEPPRFSVAEVSLLRAVQEGEMMGLNLYLRTGHVGFDAYGKPVLPGARELARFRMQHEALAALFEKVQPLSVPLTLHRVDRGPFLPVGKVAFDPGVGSWSTSLSAVRTFHVEEESVARMVLGGRAPTTTIATTTLLPGVKAIDLGAVTKYGRYAHQQEVLVQPGVIHKAKVMNNVGLMEARARWVTARASRGRVEQNFALRLGKVRARPRSLGAALLSFFFGG